MSNPDWKRALTADDVIFQLDLKPHPEGGHYRETFRDPKVDIRGRATSTAIFFLLKSGEISAWHRVDAAELWHYHAGAALALTLAPQGSTIITRELGINLLRGQTPQLVVPAGVWHTAVSRGAWSLVSCTVAPGFTFEGFEMARKAGNPILILPRRPAE